ALHDEVLMIEALMHLMLVEALRREHGGDDRHFRLKLHLHQCADHSAGHELVPIDAAVDHEAGSDDRGVASALAETRRLQGNLERARYVEDIDPKFRGIETLHFRLE